MELKCLQLMKIFVLIQILKGYLFNAFEMIGGMGGFNEVALDKYPEVEKINMFIMQATHQQLLTGLQLL